MQGCRAQVGKEVGDVRVVALDGEEVRGGDPKTTGWEAPDAVTGRKPTGYEAPAGGITAKQLGAGIPIRRAVSQADTRREKKSFSK